LKGISYGNTVGRIHIEKPIFCFFEKKVLCEFPVTTDPKGKKFYRILPRQSLGNTGGFASAKSWGALPPLTREVRINLTRQHLSGFI
jgi:hypothetical protein